MIDNVAVNLVEDSDYVYDVHAIDADEDVLDYSLAVYPPGMTIDRSSGLIVWAPTAVQIGNHPVKIEVNDGRGGVSTQEYVVCVHPDPKNNAPQFVSTPITSFYAFLNESGAIAIYVYKAEALDPDNDPLVYDLLVAPEGMHINRDTGIITWRPADAVVNESQQTVTVRVSDNRGGVDQQTYPLTLRLSGNGEIRGRKFIASESQESTEIVVESDFQTDLEGWTASHLGSVKK